VAEYCRGSVTESEIVSESLGVNNRKRTRRRDDILLFFGNPGNIDV
jgi:hypothetical protein